MKRILILLLSIMILSNCTSIIELSAVKQGNLKGKVKSVRFRVFKSIEDNGNYINGKEQGGFGSGNSLTKFDERGYKTEYIVYSLKGYKSFHRTYLYNKKGLLHKETSYYSNGDIRGVCTYTYEGNRDSLKVTEDNTNRGNPVIYTVAYNKKKRRTRKSTVTYHYDDDNNLIKEINPYFTDNWEYDENRNMIKRVYQGTYTTIRTRFKYLEFDEKGNWTRQVESRDGVSWFISERKIEYY